MREMPRYLKKTMDWMADRFELSRGERNNLQSMEGLRGLAVLLVFMVHFASLSKPWTPRTGLSADLLDALYSIGNVGVDLFFVLSGYLIYGSLLARPQHLGRFFRRRIERIYPAFLAVFALYFALSLLYPEQNRIPAGGAAATAYVVENLLLLPGIFPITPLITVAWSLSYELLYYLLVPLVISILDLRSRSAPWRVIFFVVLALALEAYCVVFGFWQIRMVMFISGILLYELIAAAPVGRPSNVLGLLALIAALCVMLLPVSGHPGNAVKSAALFVTFFYLCLACFQAPDAALARSFSWTPIRWLGNMSYSYYLIHGLSLKLAFSALPLALTPGDYGNWVPWALLPPMLLVTLLGSASLFLVVERPLSLAQARPVKLVTASPVEVPDP